MQKITSIAELRNTIQLLKVKQSRQEQKIKDQFKRTGESLKPVNLLKSTVNHIVTSPYFIDNMVGIGIGLATGYLSRKIVSGASRHILTKLIGAILTVGVTRVADQRTEFPKAPRQVILKNIFRKRELNAQK